ncbi:hypothetical protein KKF38_01640 [Patescibacteria group bacterium]|nr:hypothetical protein [Patescibacteria group bacterium]
MADENTQNPANPDSPTRDADVAPSPAKKVSPSSESELLELREKQPVADTEPQTLISEAAEIPAKSETQTVEISAEEAEEIPTEEITEAAPEIQTESEIAQPEETQQIPAKEVEVEEIPAETPAPQAEEVAAEEIAGTIPQPQPQPEIQPESEVVAPEEEIIRGAPAKPGDKTETIPSSPPLPESVFETPPNGAVAGSIPPKAEKNAQPKSGFKPDGVTPLDGEEKIFAALGYVGILALLPLLTRRDSEFAQHHGRQGLVVAIIFIVLWLFAKLGDTLSNLVFVLQFAATVGGFALAYKGDWFRIPGIYDLSLKIKLNPSSQTSSNETQNSEEESPPPPQN